MNDEKKVDLSVFPSIESLKEIVKAMKKEKARWNAGSWIHKPDSWQNKAINTLKKEIQSRKDFEASLRSYCEGCKFKDTKTFCVLCNQKLTPKDVLGGFE